MSVEKNEAQVILDIMGDFLSPEQAKEITKRLNNQVGQNTNDQSLKKSFELLESLYKEGRPDRYVKLRQTFLITIIAIHAAIIIANFAAMFIIAWAAPWYVALPVITLIINLMFSPITCPLTKLESKIRRSLGMPEIKFFIAHYFFKPVRGYMHQRAQRKLEESTSGQRQLSLPVSGGQRESLV